MCKKRRSGCTGEKKKRKKKQIGVDNQYQPSHRLFIKQSGTRVRQTEIVQWVISALFVYIATLLCVHSTIAVMNKRLVGLKYTQIGSLRKICRQRVWVAELVGGIFQAFQLCWCWENGTEPLSSEEALGHHPLHGRSGFLCNLTWRVQSRRLEPEWFRTHMWGRVLVHFQRPSSFLIPALTLPRDRRDPRLKIDKMSPAEMRILEQQCIKWWDRTDTQDASLHRACTQWECARESWEWQSGRRIKRMNRVATAQLKDLGEV